ncbi:MAG: TadE/TadG family type IV pilus assembly protein [Solirubrobacterales bacterium]
MSRLGWRAQRGQASAELVAVIPALLLAVLVAAQLAVIGWALWSAGSAARAGARAAHVGGDAEAAARSALPTHLRRGVRVSDEEEVGVRVRVPALVPGVPRIPLEASAALDPDPSGG